ncbi:hypothetical protein HDV00_009026 [Rhizophlyctis rosea]|nr:hypothetical protein HDV00_009026 [Rhizophlyctis rosea]
MHAKILAAALFLAPSALAADQWGQCGGIGFKGDARCPAGWVCQYWNDYYSQCIVPATTTTTRRTTTTTKTTTKPTTTTTKTTTKPTTTTTKTTTKLTTTTTTTKPTTTTTTTKSTTTTTVPPTTTTTTTTTTVPTTTTTTVPPTTTTTTTTTVPTTTTTSATASPTAALDDITVYHGNALASGWENWSWSTTFNWAYTGPPAAPAGSGGSSVQVTTGGYGGVSFRNPAGYAGYKTIIFSLAGGSQWGLVADSTTEPFTSTAVAIGDSCKETINSDTFVTCYFDLSKLGDHAWDRFTFQSWSGGDQTTEFANIFISSKTALELTDTKSFSGGAAFGSNTLLLLGTGDITTVSITNPAGKAVTVSNPEVLADPSAHVYATLSESWTPGNYTITHSAGVITVSIPQPVKGDLASATGTKPISPWIYGMNLPSSSQHVSTYGFTLTRWGGNAMTPYNPISKWINAAADWYFENRAADAGGFEAWSNMISAGHAKAVFSVPMLDWVAKNITCSSYPVSVYGPQDKADPYNADAGNGLVNGTRIKDDPSRCYDPWGPKNLTAYLASWDQSQRDKVAFFTIGNELDIADGTHPDIMQEVMSYDSELARLKAYGQAIRAGIPDAKIMGPTSCCFWFWWHSGAGDADTAAHNGTSKLRYLLRSLHAYDAQVGKKTIDYLDLHFNPQEGRSSDGSAADNASRLRSSRAWWDKSYADESYMGQTSVYGNEPNPGSVFFIPRMKQLIADEYPGLGLSVTEWYNSNDLVGGLQIADTLGIFAREGLDVATKWANTDIGSPGAAAYWLYTGGYGSTKPFPSKYLNVPIFYNPDVAAAYFGKSDSNLVAGVFVNKDPSQYQHYKISGWKAGNYTLRHFGYPGVKADQGALFEATVMLDSSSTVVVPPYAAIFLSQ